MLHRSHRFHGFGSLDHIYRHGQIVRSQFMSLKWMNSKVSTYRVAVVVSKKVAKSAPKRNRIRRRIYEAVRELSITSHVDVVITVFDERVATLPSEDVRDMVSELCLKAQIIKES